MDTNVNILIAFLHVSLCNLETDFLDKAQAMSQRLEPPEIFHNEILVLVKDPRAFHPVRPTIPRVAGVVVWVPACAHGSSRADSRSLAGAAGGLLQSSLRLGIPCASLGPGAPVCPCSPWWGTHYSLMYLPLPQRQNVRI